MKRWFVVHTQAHAEQKVCINLRAQNFETYLPFYFRIRRHARRVDRVMAPLFPRYIFVRVDVEEARWRSVNGTIGAHHLICQGDAPISVPDHVIAEIRAREDESGAVRLSKILPPKPGDAVRFVSGPMLDRRGIFECERDDDRIVVLLELLGRPTRVAVAQDSVILCA